MSIQIIEPESLKEKIDKKSKEPFLLLDVRNPNEQEICLIKETDKLIPLPEISQRIDEIEKYKESEIILYCRSGKRSMEACEILYSNGFEKLYNLKGGVLAYADKIDTTLAKY